MFSSVLVRLSVLILLVLTKPGLPEDRGALVWWMVGDVWLLTQRVTLLLQAGILFPGQIGAPGLSQTTAMLLCSMSLVAGMACQTISLLLFCHYRPGFRSKLLLAAILPLVAPVVAILLPGARLQLMVPTLATLMLASQFHIVRRNRTGSPALAILCATMAMMILVAVGFIGANAFGFVSIPVPVPGGAYAPPVPALLCDFIASVTMTYAMVVALQERQHRFFAKLSTVDPLTGALNRRGMRLVVEQSLRGAEMVRRPVSVAIIDIDHFKRVNDRFGHDAGDAVLHAFAGALLKLCRDGDVLARWGGEEFLLLMPDTSAEHAVAALHRMRMALPDLLGPSAPCTVTFSAGVCEWCHAAGETTIDALVSDADKCLYAAKITRDCIVSRLPKAAPDVPALNTAGEHV